MRADRWASSRRFGRLLAVGLLVAGLLVLAGPSPVGAAGDEREPARERDLWTVVLDDSTDDPEAPARVVPAGAERLGPRTWRADLTPARAAALARRPGVRSVHRDAPVRAADVPDDPCIRDCGGQWHLDAVGAPAAWAVTRGDPGVVVAVLDGPVETTHPDLAGKLLAPVDATDASFPTGCAPGPATPEGHGTHVAGVVGAATDNGMGVAGLGWHTRVLPVQVLKQDGNGCVSWVVRGIRAAVDAGADVLNLSVVSAFDAPELRLAVEHAVAAGVVVVAAAGNTGEGDHRPLYPAAYPEVVAVGAHDPPALGGGASTFSARGHQVDLLAPGRRILSTTLSEECGEGSGSHPCLGTRDGTSMAAPMVSATLALMMAGGEDHDVSTWRRLLEVTAAPNPPSAAGASRHGRLDTAAAVRTWVPYTGFRGGVRLATGELHPGDAGPEIATGAGPGGGPHVRVLTRDGSGRASFFPYSRRFTGGVHVATGDLDGDGTHEIITAPGPGGGPHIRTFTATGTPLTSFHAYNPHFTGGVHVATGDLDGDGTHEIITAPGPTGGPHVRSFSGSGVPLRSLRVWRAGGPLPSGAPASGLVVAVAGGEIHVGRARGAPVVRALP